MIYDGVDLSRYALIRCPRPVMAPMTFAASVVAGCDGFEVSDVRMESFECEAEFTVIPTTVGGTEPEGIRSADACKRAIASALAKRGKRPLVFDSDPDRYCMAIVMDVTQPERTGVADTFNVVFMCDPVFYSRDESSVAVSNGDNEVDVAGTLPAVPVFTITAAGASDRLVVTNADTGESVAIPGPIDDGASVAIDMSARRATVNGADIAVSILSDFFGIGPGLAHVAITGGSGSMSYRGRWV